MKNSLIISSRKDYKNSTLFLYIFFCFFLFACKKEAGVDKVPTALTNVTVENNPGETIVSYEAPSEQDIILVTVVLPNEDGGFEIRRYKLPEHMSSFTLKGLPPSKKTIELYTVNSLGVESERVEVEIDPKLTLSAVYLNSILETVEFEPILGGMRLKFDNNNDNLNLSFNISYVDSKGDWVIYPEVLSDDKSSTLILQDFVYSEFKLTIQNELKENSNYLSFAIDPVVEYELDKTKWKNAKLPSDNWLPRQAAIDMNLLIENIWDGNSSAHDIHFETGIQAFPQWFTIDLGEDQTLKLTKIKVHQHANWRVNTYTKFHPKVFEIWGSNDPNPDGSWDGWVELVECNSYQPSNSSFGTATVADHEYILQGEEFRFPLDTDSYRYIRFKTVKTWDPDVVETYIRLQEITLWGY